MNSAWPLQIDARGRTALATDDQHIRQLIEQLLFTNPGERVNRPTFGGGVVQLVFAPSNDTLATALQVTVQAAIQQTLGDIIEVDDLMVEAVDSVLKVELHYRNRVTGATETAFFERSV